MQHGILPSLTKDFILSKITQEQIFEKYLGISVTTDGLFKAPLSLRASDNNPTCSFYYSDNGKLRLRDWAGYFWGDCFDIVAYLNRLDSRNKRDFGVILDTIARDFCLHKYAGNIVQTGTTFDVRDANTKVKKKTLITFRARNWMKQDADFWKAGNMTSKGLEEGRVYPCAHIWVNNNLIYNFTPNDPAYAYYFTPSDIKIYFPLRKTYRFIGNTSYLQGIDLLIPDRIGIITKSYKDVLSMKTFNLQAVAPSSESTPVSKQQWFKLKWTCSHWFTLMDFDRQGVVMTNKLRKLYPVQPLFFGSYHFPEFSNKHYKAFKSVKDFYDFVKHYGKDATYQLIDEVKYHFAKEFDDYDSYTNHNLKLTNKQTEPLNYE